MRISTTSIESFRLFMDPEQEWMLEADLIASIRGERTATAKMTLGTAFGAVLEDPDRYLVPGGFRYVGDSRESGVVYEFGRDVVEPCLELIDRRGVSEVKATKQYGPHTIVAKADHLIGARIVEYKTTLSTFDFDKYEASYQWRFEMDIFQPVSLTYHVFCLSESAATGVISLRSIESFDLYPYAACHQDCCALLEQFAAYATARGLDGYLNERQIASEAA